MFKFSPQNTGCNLKKLSGKLFGNRAPCAFPKMGSVGHFPVTGRQMSPVTEETPTELFDITARE